MAKKKSPVDAALEVARKVRIPKKPVKAKGKKTVPTKLDWGPGIPEDKLAYLNDDEMALVQAKRGYKGKRSVDGIPAFPDPGDTAAGDRGTGSSGRPSSGGSRGPDRGPTGGPSSGNGGLGGGGKGGTSGGAGGAGGLGGGGKGGLSGGAGGTSSSGAGAGAGSSDKGQKTTGPSGGPSGGPTSAPARTEPSRAAAPSGTFGPRMASMPGTPVSTAPSTHAYENALNSIARGSSIIGGPAAPKIQDRVPQATPTPVSFSQAPTISGPNRGLAGVNAPTEDLFSGANSPFADPSVESYTPTYSSPQAARSLASSVLGPSVPAGTAHKTPEAMARQASLYGTPVAPSSTIGVDPNKYSVAVGPSQPSTLASDMYNNVFGGPARAVKDQSRVPGSVAGGPTFTPDGSSQVAKDQSRLGISTSYGDVSPEQLSSMSQEDQQRLAQAPTYTPPNIQAQNYGFVNPNVPTSPTRGIPAVSSAPPATVADSFVRNPYNRSPAEQARDIRNAIAAATGRQPTSTVASTEIDVPYWSPDVSPSQGDVSPSQQPAYDVSPSQQSGWTDAQREAYLSGLAGSRQAPVRPILPNRQTPPVTQVASVPPTYLQPLPDWQDYSYLYNEYPQIVSATPVIAGFNQYNATMNRGGRIGTSVDAAMRLARQSIVSRNKTR